MRISDWSSDVCSSDLIGHLAELPQLGHPARLVFNRIRSHGGKPILAVDDRLGNAHVRLRPHEVDYLPNRPPLPKLDEFLEGLGPSRLVLMTADAGPTGVETSEHLAVALRSEGGARGLHLIQIGRAHV